MTPRPRLRWWLFKGALAINIRTGWPWSGRLAWWLYAGEWAGDGGAKCGEGAPF